MNQFTECKSTQIIYFTCFKKLLLPICLSIQVILTIKTIQTLFHEYYHFFPWNNNAKQAHQQPIILWIVGTFSRLVSLCSKLHLILHLGHLLILSVLSARSLLPFGLARRVSSSLLLLTRVHTLALCHHSTKASSI